MNNKGTIVYIGGFVLPDKNAAAQRVVGIAKGLKAIGYNVIFLNSVKGYEQKGVSEKDYFGFKCYEYKREKGIDYLFTGTTALVMIGKIKPDAIIAYNYPAVSLNNIRKYCLVNNIKCYADATEWYEATGNNIFYNLVKNFDSSYRMKKVHKKLDGVIAISRYLYNYYKDSINTVLIPPTVDISEEKWESLSTNNVSKNETSLVYAGVPSAQKERLDSIVQAIESVSKKYSVKLNIVGISKEQFAKIYEWKEPLSNGIVFWGRLSHLEVLQIIKQSNWAIILRDKNKVVQAGFPTKLVESISCGIPVIANRFSNIEEYLSDSNSIVVEKVENMAEYIIEACCEQKSFDNSIFDFHNYLNELELLFSTLKS